MKHTQGEVKVSQGIFVRGIGKMGKPICSCSSDFKSADEAIANAKRIKDFWNAFHGISTHDALNIIQIGISMKDDEQSMKYLEHGPEMEKIIQLIKTWDNYDLTFPTLRELLNKLEGK